jgi:hypothetical protein
VTEAGHLAAGCHRPIHKIADEIGRLWKEPPNEARPYIYGLRHLATIEDKVGSDDAEDIILRFLGNARGWHGEDARRIKQELRGLLPVRSRR